MVSDATREECNTIDVRKGKVVWTDRLTAGYFQCAVWAPDSATVAYAFCVAAPTKDAPKRYEAHIFVVDLETRKVRRFRRDFSETNKGSMRHYGCDLEWTADGKRLIVGPNWITPLLLDIRTGAFTSLREPITRHFKQPGDTRWYSPEIHPYPTYMKPGWHANRAPDGKVYTRYAPDIHPFTKPGWLWMKGPDGKTYALDYKAKRFVYISSAERIVPCPGGEKIIEIKNERDVSIRKCPKLPPLDDVE